MRQSVYIETTIPSYYATTRPGLDADVARTREWWDVERGGYECYASPVVIDELSEGEYPSRARCLELVQALPLLAVNEDVLRIAEAYQASKVMPGPPVRDALHVALACHYRMDFLLTWNCVHIANANKMRHLRTINARLGLSTPLITTPHLLRPLEELP
ncbi:MAG TPA: type II toxin-antitoxin system VapC family toxin [Phycisphaerales bacterium]|nr:type II toxin-antitoxin system VapC family toxin [Phycisphaerales bacterium]